MASSRCLYLYWNAVVPPWLEILLDFIGFARLRRACDLAQDAPREDDERARGVSVSCSVSPQALSRQNMSEGVQRFSKRDDASI